MSKKINLGYGANGFRVNASTDGTDNGLALWNEHVKQTGDKLLKANTVENHMMFAYQIIEPLKTVMDYTEWTDIFFHREPASIWNPHRFINSDGGYTATSWVTSPDGTPKMVRPGRSTFEGVGQKRYTTGLEFTVDQLRAQGWDMAGRKVEEAGQEMARKRDAVRLALLDAAVTATGGTHVPTVASSMTYASLRSIVQTAVGQLFRPTFCVINPRRLWDMGDWTLPSNSMWQIPREIGQQVMFENGHILNLFNLSFHVYDSVPMNTVWFGSQMGQDYELVFNEMESAVETHPIERRSQYAWFEDLGHYVRSGLRLWKLSIT